MNNSLLELKEPYNQEYTHVSSQTASVEIDSLKAVVNTKYSPLAKLQNIAIKRFLDIFISLIATLFFLSWLLPILAVLIKLDSAGPVFFVQKRGKKNGDFFFCLKLRTMVVNQDADVLTATFNDKRITRLGRFLRKNHLDELPQLINVLIGDMSIIGPRPHMFLENLKYNSIYNFYHKRHSVKPGMTGLAQSLGYHGPVSDVSQIERKIKYDIFYINNWSLFLDLKILTNTLVIIYKKFVYPSRY